MIRDVKDKCIIFDLFFLLFIDECFYGFLKIEYEIDLNGRLKNDLEKLIGRFFRLL